MSISPQWRDKVAAAEYPPVVDSDGVCEIIEKFEGQRPSPNTIRRWPLQYKLLGRKRMYEVEAVIAYVRQRYAEAPVRVAAVSRRRSAPSENAA